MTKLRFYTGFTLIEMLVAIVLSSILVLVMLAVFVSSKNTSVLQDGLMRVQEDGRIALHVVSDEIRKAGFRKPVWNDPANGYTPLTQASVNGANGTSDTLQIMYMDDVDCNGVVNANNDPETFEPQALYKRVTFAVDNAEVLHWTCEYGMSPGSLAIQSSNQPIVDNVESFQVLYGIDTDFPPDFSVNAWTTADTISPHAAICLQSQYLCEAGGLINEMRDGLPVALQVAMLIASPEGAGSDTDSQSYQVLDVTRPAQNDQRLRKVYSTTVNLRNLTL